MNVSSRNRAPQSKHPLETRCASPRWGWHNWMQANIKAYVDGEQGPLRRRVTAWHLQQCAACRKEAAWMQQVQPALLALETADARQPGPQLRARILASLPHETPMQLAQPSRPMQSRSRAARRPQLAFAGITAILIMTGAIGLNLRPQARAPQRQTLSAGDVVQASVGPYRVLAVFSAPQNSFSAADASSTHATDRNAPQDADAGSTAATIGSTQVADRASDADASASPAPSEETYTDPTSREADRLASLKLPEKLSEKRQQVAAIAQSAPPVVPTFSVGAAAARSATPQIALAVVDVDGARQQIQQWADLSGAKLRVMTTKTAFSETHAPNETTFQMATLLELRVPARFADSLKGQLSHLGTPLPLAPAMQSHKAGAVRPATPVDAVTHSYVLPPNVMHKAFSDSGEALVILRVRLQPVEAAAH